MSSDHASAQVVRRHELADVLAQYRTYVSAAPVTASASQVSQNQ